MRRYRLFPSVKVLAGFDSSYLDGFEVSPDYGIGELFISDGEFDRITSKFTGATYLARVIPPTKQASGGGSHQLLIDTSLSPLDTRNLFMAFTGGRTDVGLEIKSVKRGASFQL